MHHQRTVSLPAQLVSNPDPLTAARASSAWVRKRFPVSCFLKIAENASILQNSYLLIGNSE
jgi:hypothetical protein